MFRAAAAAGARRFVYASSVAAYGFHADNPELIDEDWPVRPAARLFYAQEKAELEDLLRGARRRPHPELALYLLRPPVVLGPNVVGGKDVLPGPLAPLGRRLFGRPRRLPGAGAAAGARAPAAVHPRGGRRPGAACSASSAPARRGPTTSPATAS